MRAVNPKIVLCAITGYGQDGPLRDRAGHDMNYLGLVGLLGLSGEAGGPPVQAAPRSADSAAARSWRPSGSLPPCARPSARGEGQVVDIAMADGALSWLAMVAARYLATGEAARAAAASSSSPAGWPATGPTSAPTAAG